MFVGIREKLSSTTFDNFSSNRAVLEVLMHASTHSTTVILFPPSPHQTVHEILPHTAFR